MRAQIEQIEHGCVCEDGTSSPLSSFRPVLSQRISRFSIVFSTIFGDKKTSFLQCQEPLLAQTREETRRAEEEHAAEKDATNMSQFLQGKQRRIFATKHGYMSQLKDDM